jgi:hypothetical protein
MRWFPISLRLPQRPRLLASPVAAIQRPALPITASTILLLLLLPVLGLSRWPRPRAEGLEQLMGTASLLQSFPATPDRPLPDLWAQRFGRPLAERLWRQQRRTWWQFWGPHVDGAPFLAVSSIGFPGSSASSLPPNSLKVGDLVVVAPDPLSRQLLADRLGPVQRRSRGLERGCLQRLEQEQAVFWNPSSLGVILGPVAPLLQRFQEGCLALELEPRGLRWQGEAAAVDGVLTPSSPMRTPSQALPTTLLPLSADLLLELEGASLDQLLQGLLSRQLIREPLASRYGIDESRLPLLRRAPFRLRLRPQVSGPFQASLELQLAVGVQKREWEQLLLRLAKALQEQGLGELPQTSTPTPPGATAPVKSPPAQPARAATWSRDDGVVVGGWRWLALPGREGQQLLLFLGPPPLAPVPMGAGAGEPQAPGGLSLRVRPAALDQLGLLPAEMPLLVRRSEQLWLKASPLSGSGGQPSDPISQLKGRLQVRQ